MSLGLTANYLLSVNEDALGNIPDFGQRVDLKAMINECIEIRTQHGCLSGLNLGLHNFGAHLGFRYFLPMVLDYLEKLEYL
jgi:hypothetical protein